MDNSLNVACVQMTSGSDISENLKNVAILIREAAAKGAQFIATPENTCHIRSPMEEKLNSSLPQDEHPGMPFFSALAKELGITLLIGSMTIKTAPDKLANRSFLFAPDGSLKATYDKIHLFDVSLKGGEVYRESDVIEAGDKAVSVSVGHGFQAGLSICYDVRFAHLYRDLAKAGANILCVPAAFTVPTGKAHWEALLRTRAIETGCYVMAPAQVGEHEGGRKTYGHSMIINPWGEILSCQETGEGSILAELNMGDVDSARTAIPALQHDKPYTMSTV